MAEMIFQQNKLIQDIIKIFQKLLNENKLVKLEILNFTSFANYTKLHKHLINIIEDANKTNDITNPINYKRICEYIKFGATICQEYTLCSGNINFTFLMDDYNDYSWNEYVYNCNKALIDTLKMYNEQTICICQKNQNKPHYKVASVKYCELGTPVKEVYINPLHNMIDINERVINIHEGFLPNEYIARRYKMINGHHETKYVDGTYTEKELETFPDYHYNIIQEIAELNINSEPKTKRLFKGDGTLIISENSAFTVLY